MTLRRKNRKAARSRISRSRLAAIRFSPRAVQSRASVVLWLVVVFGFGVALVELIVFGYAIASDISAKAKARALHSPSPHVVATKRPSAKRTH